MKEFAFDKEKAIALAEQLGLTVKLNSDTPGIYCNGKEVDVKEIFPELKKLEEDKCLILSEDEAVKHQSEWEYPVLIRIADKDGDLPPLDNQKQYKGILELYFYDLRVTEDEWRNRGLEKYPIFTDLQAFQLFSFIENHKKADSFVIHCGAGVSRSPAIAIGVAIYLGDTDLANRIMDSNKYSPNQHVLDVINKKMDETML